MATNTQIPMADRRAPVIEPGTLSHTIGDKISNIVLKRHISLGWVFGFFVMFSLMNMLSACPRVFISQGHRHLGHHHPDRLGIRDCQFCVVDRYRPRGHADLGDLVLLRQSVAEFDQPLRRSHDAVRRGLRRNFPAGAHWTSVACLLDVPLPEHDGLLAAVP